MAIDCVLRIPQNEDDEAFVLVQVSSAGSKTLDLKLIGTEGEAPYSVKLKHENVASLRVKNCPASQAEWQSILEAVFTQSHLPDIQTTATVQSETSIVITVRKQVQGITQRLGAITLKHDPGEAIELFGWCGKAAADVVALKESASTTDANVSQLEVAVQDLKTQLDELIKAKDEDETILLQKFQDLLNEKKVKIREQQKIIASGSFASSNKTAPDEHAANPPTVSRRPAKSRANKRKAPNTRNGAAEDTDENENEELAINIKTEPADTDDGNTTDGTASTATSDEDEEEERENTRASTATKHLRTNKTITPPKKTGPPPPRRNLPFMNAKVVQPTTGASAGDETESDDEL